MLKVNWYEISNKIQFSDVKRKKKQHLHLLKKTTYRVANKEQYEYVDAVSENPSLDG